MDENKIVIDYEKAPFKDSLKANCYKLPSALKMYLFSFFPIFQWITKYNTEVGFFFLMFFFSPT
jgi:sodium-independent sulfate anion transporter 11